MIIEIKDILVSSDIITEEFCCDLSDCHGQCCIEGDAGAPVTLDEVMEMENRLDDVWEDLSASAQAVIDKQGVSYIDQEGDMVTSIVGGKDCVFTFYSPLQLPEGHQGCEDPSSATPKKETMCCLCAFEKLYRQQMANKTLPLGGDGGGLGWCKPISCALYPIREKKMSNGITALNYHFWNVCAGARKKGKELHLPVYKFLREPLIRRFGEEWYEELCTVADELRRQGITF